MTEKIKKYAKDKAGFSFVELMVVIALIGVLSAIALPGLLGSLPEKRLRGAARNLYVDLQKARLRAVKENRAISVGFDATGAYLTPGEPFTDLNGNGTYDSDIPEPFIDTNLNGVYDSGEPFTDINGNGVYSAHVAEPYIDLDGNYVFTLNLYELKFTDYSSIVYGCPTGATDWSGSPVPASGISITGNITFTSTGTCNSATVYLQSINTKNVCYAVTTTDFGAVKIRRGSISGSTTSWQ